MHQTHRSSFNDTKRILGNKVCFQVFCFGHCLTSVTNYYRRIAEEDKLLQNFKQGGGLVVGEASLFLATKGVLLSSHLHNWFQGGTLISIGG